MKMSTTLHNLLYEHTIFILHSKDKSGKTSIEEFPLYIIIKMIREAKYHRYLAPKIYISNKPIPKTIQYFNTTTLKCNNKSTNYITFR